MSGAELIAAERERQTSVEGWTTEHDDGHANGELAMAACCYAAPSPIRASIPVQRTCGCRSAGECTHTLFQRTRWADPWPWDAEWDKRGQHNRIKQLTIAGALIAAEIDRLQRLDTICQAALAVMEVPDA